MFKNLQSYGWVWVPQKKTYYRSNKLEKQERVKKLKFDGFALINKNCKQSKI